MLEKERKFNEILKRRSKPKAKRKKETIKMKKIFKGNKN